MKKLKKLASIALVSSVVLSGMSFHTVSAAHLTQSQLKGLEKNKSLQSSVARISENLDTNSKKKVSVIVQLKSVPVVVAKHTVDDNERVSASSTETRVSKEQSAFIKAAANAGIKVNVDRTFNYLINAVELKVTANEIPKLAKLPNVVSVYENRTITVDEPSATDELSDEEAKKLPSGNYDISPLTLLNVPAAWEMGYTGKGVKVGVIDTGVDYLHPDLQDAYRGGYDSIDDDDDPYETMPVQKYPTDHGTHVSGTIAGRAQNKDSDVHVRGVAYDSNLYMYRVLGPSPTGGNGSVAQVIDGIEHAVKDGMQVINLSLGSDYVQDPYSPDSIVLNNAVLQGVVACVANGNAANKDGFYYYTSGSPANAYLPISVGASTVPVKKYESNASSSYGSNYNLYAVAWQTNNENFSSILGSGAHDVVYANLGTVADFSKVDVKGKVALVSRGNLAFVDKIANAKDAGAIAVVLFNGNSKGDKADLDMTARSGYINVFTGDDPQFIPTFDMKGTEGRALAKEILANPEKPLKFTFGKKYSKITVPGDRMADFSSRGPGFDDNYSIKPDVVAPGTAILSSIPAYGKEFGKDANYKTAYTRLQGTSMATPHVAGMAALILEAHPDYTPFDVKAALANTADTIYDENNVRYDVYSQGAGRANVVEAIETPALLQTVEQLQILTTDHTTRKITNYGDNVSFGLVGTGGRAKKELQLKNTSKKDLTYKAEVIMHKKVTSNPMNPVATPSTGNIDVGLSTNTIEVRGQATKGFDLELAVNRHAEEGVYEGEVLLKSEDGYPDLHLPFVVHVGDKREETTRGFDSVKLSNAQVTPDGDNKNDTFNVNFDLQADDVIGVGLEVYGYDDNYFGMMDWIENTDKSGDVLRAGKYSFKNLSNVYTTSDADGNEEQRYLPDGDYQLRLTGVVNGEDQEPAVGYEAWKSITIKHASKKPKKDEFKQDVEEAIQSFKPNSENTKVVGDAVLSLPTHQNRLTYKVVGSSNEKYVNKKGVLIALPDEKTEITLQIKISSNYDKTIYQILKYKVTFECEEIERDE